MALSRNEIKDKLGDVLSMAISDADIDMSSIDESSNLVTDIGLNSVGILYIVSCLITEDINGESCPQHHAVFMPVNFRNKIQSSAVCSQNCLLGQNGFFCAVTEIQY